MLDKGVASVAAVVVEELAHHSHCQQATVAEEGKPARHFAVLATGGKQREAGSGWEDRKRAGIVAIVARALLQQEPGQGNWQLRCPFELMR